MTTPENKQNHYFYDGKSVSEEDFYAKAFRVRDTSPNWLIESHSEKPLKEIPDVVKKCP